MWATPKRDKMDEIERGPKLGGALSPKEKALPFLSVSDHFQNDFWIHMKSYVQFMQIQSLFPKKLHKKLLSKSLESWESKIVSNSI